MKTPTLLELQILRALKIKNGDVSYLKETLARADACSSSGSNVFNWKEMTRRDVWNITNALINKGWIYRIEEMSESTTRDKVTYIITEEGLNLLSACETTLQLKFLTSA